MENCAEESSGIKRWDGAARACKPWDNLGRDPELWYRDGNCFVHLYKKGQSRRGPSFKVPIDALIEAKCHPLVARFVVRGNAAAQSDHAARRYFDSVAEVTTNGRTEFYIPAPPMATKAEALRYHLAIRNFFAWVFRRSMVGEHLGTALIWLLDSMTEFRCPGQDNMGDLLSYMDEEGYLDMRNQPVHALALLHFAEHVQKRDVYINAFTHCTGMSEELHAVGEYQELTSVTRKLLRRARGEMDTKLGQAGSMLRNFLEEDLSEAHIGLSEGGRAHLERFRSFLLTFYTSRLGYYPPVSIDPRSLIFGHDVYRLMHDDFRALYDFLADKKFTTSSGSMSSQALGGICALQCVHAFDLRHGLEPLKHPIPLLPETVQPPGSGSAVARRISWLSRTDKLKPDRRLLVHAALAKATNKSQEKNLLVSAYRKFEEDYTTSPSKNDREEAKLSQSDARKIRWIMVYCVYQVLMDCTKAPAECFGPDIDLHGVRYNIAIDTSELPPWEKGNPTVDVPSRSMTPVRQVSNSVPNLPTPASPERWLSSFDPYPLAGKSKSDSCVEIKPDVDYFALLHRHDDQGPDRSSSGSPLLRGEPPFVIPPRMNSLNKSFRRSLRLFTPAHSTRDSGIVISATGGSDRGSGELVTRPKTQSRRLSYHEIVVQGYGNGTLNNVHVEKQACFELDAGLETEIRGLGQLVLDPSRTPSTLSTASSTNSARFSDSSSTPTSTTASSRACSGVSLTSSSSCESNSGRDDGAHDASSGTAAVQAQKIAMSPPALPRRSSKRNLLVVSQTATRKNSLCPDPLVIRKGPQSACDADDTTTCTLRGGGGGGMADKYREDLDDLWSQFADVGGLTDISK